MVGTQTVALEAMARRLRELGNILLNVDMFERWGPKEGAQAEQMARDGAAAGDEYREVEARLDAAIDTARVEAPDVLAEWSAAHIRLLDEVLARETDGTSRSVASDEREAWSKLPEGGPRVRQNVFYVSYDPALYAELFGLEP